VNQKVKELEKAVRKAIKKNNWLILSTVDSKSRPHSCVLVYQSNGNVIYCQTGNKTFKARNIRNNENVSVTIPIRKNFFHKLIPAPPAEIHFTTKAELREKDDEEARKIYAKYLKYDDATPQEVEKIWIRIPLPEVIATYGVGVKLLKMRKPEEARNILRLD
jgi:uncharacterized protein YhbP (UPF0306 family)